jgi:hypothetical protein
MPKRNPPDTIEFTLLAEETIINNTVKIVARIAGMIKSDVSEQKLKDSIREVITRFIDADWEFSNMVRTSHQSGMEQVTVTATARVPESENHALDRRREVASRDLDWMQIVSAVADTSPSPAQIEETQSKLRVAIIRKAQRELKLINETVDETYRIGRIAFNSTYNADVPRANVMASMSASAPRRVFDPDFDIRSEDLGNAVKLTMLAMVELRHRT